MADEGIYATTAEILRRAGVGASATSSAEGYTNDYIAQAEAEISSITRFDWSAVYSGLTATTRDILKLAAASHAANSVAIFDLSGYTSRTEGENLINVNRDNYLRAIGLLKKKEVKVFINGS